MRDTSERVAGTAEGNHQLRWRRTEEGGTRHGKPRNAERDGMRCRVVGHGGYKYEDGILLQGSCTDTARVGGARAHDTVRTGSEICVSTYTGSARAHAAAVWREAAPAGTCTSTCRQQRSMAYG